jgi:phosphohistidine phosphatase
VKRLLLLRHAKAVPGTTKSGDQGRPLNERGRLDAPRMGIAMQHKRYLPDRVLCSTSKRTLETWEHVAPELDGEPEVICSDELYLAPWKVIANMVRAQPKAAGVVLVVGHNPGLEECARALARKPRTDDERQRLDTLNEKFPTSALAVLDFDTEIWSEIASGAGVLTDFIRARTLTGE